MRRRAILWVALLGLTSVAAPAARAAGPTADPYFDRQWGLQKISAERAWRSATGAGTLIAIVDSGVDLDHPDLSPKLMVDMAADMVEPKGECGGKKKECVQDGPNDEDGHGTHVAGIAGAATGNGVGVAGTAPDASLLPVRVLDHNGDGTAAWIGQGIRFAVDKGADVINLSLGISSGLDRVEKLRGNVDAIYEAIDYADKKGVVVVIAAGNDSFPLCSEPSAHPKAICVGATDRNDVRSFYSNSDATMSSKFVVAPGGDAITCSGDIFSTYLQGEDRYCSDEDGYEAASGTSMAAPFVSGVAALLAGQGLDAAQIVACIISTTDDLGVPRRDSLYGYGRVNAYKAVTACT